MALHLTAIAAFLLTFTSLNIIVSPKSIKIASSACDGTLYPQLCVSTLSTFPNLRKKTLPQIISAAVNVTVVQVKATASNSSGIRRKIPHLDARDKRALQDCVELLGHTVTELNTAVSDLSSNNHYYDLQTLLSGAMTNQYTCLDGFAYSDSNVRSYIEESITDISRHVSNSLALVTKIKQAASRNEVFPEYGRVEGGHPSWISREDKAVVEATGEVNYDLVVAKDGSGNFTTIGAAVAAAPDRSKKRFVIYVKAGAYYEYVEVESKKTMLMLVGDGIGNTLVKGNRSVVDGWTTFRSATVAVVGNGFIAKGITFENYAGPSKHQAVALRSGSDLSAFYKCSFVGYQDTLYVHSLRQFYRECDVYGTVDFIFGNAAVVFQNCALYARKPNEKQKNIFTAQGREDPNQNTGISIINSKLAAAVDLIPVQSSFKSYIGRPWKLYSRTVILQSYIGDLVEAAGWLEWDGEFALSTLYYGEYSNRGPGSNTSSRVTWPGYRVITNRTEASQFTVGSFIQGGDWLNSTTVPFFLGLS
ncbi:pectinesterase [Apium graveolens]|uniref:pectinesterase n=1 Tax=Apium graveolens TaxID=4045 RepID=UPI003D7B841D